jgi:ribonuclease P protein component
MAFYFFMESSPGKMDENIRYRLRKEERLSSRKLLEKIFSEGKSFLVYPLKVIYVETEIIGNIPIKAAFAVSKKSFKKAVTRNLIKRRMREAYRLNKQQLKFPPGKSFKAIVFIYIGKEVLNFRIIEKSIKRVFEKL